LRPQESEITTFRVTQLKPHLGVVIPIAHADKTERAPETNKNNNSNPARA
jgi:hypothetical protein